MKKPLNHQEHAAGSTKKRRTGRRISVQKVAAASTTTPKEDLVVFALRMTAAERSRLHETAGPRGAARLARAVLIAAANEDDAAFKAAVAEARTLRA